MSVTNNEMLILENEYLALSINSQTGVIEALHNKASQLDLIAEKSRFAWRLEVDGVWITEYESFTSQLVAEGRFALQWRTTSGIVVEATIELVGDTAQFTAQVLSTPTAAVDKLEYPIFAHIGNLHSTADSYLLHSQGTGFLFKNPHTLFELESGSKQGMRYSPYPEGFSGSPTQLMAYYAENVGGFYFAAHDATKAMKWLNFYKTETGTLECSFMHQSPDVKAGANFVIPYPVVVAALSEGNWYAAAERYKTWATQQHWTAQGTLHERKSSRKLVIEDAGIATFGVNAAHDRSAWLDYFHQIAKKPIFHVIGPNWAHYGADYHNHLPGGRVDWFPSRFNTANLETIRRNGDTWAPFEFNLLLSPERAESDEIKASLITLADNKYSFDAYAFPFVCPVTDYLQQLHSWRDETVVREDHPDAVYYDISINNVVMMCRNPEHGHPVGGGHWVVDAYSKMFADTKAAMDSAAGEYIAQGTEMINEVFIPIVDYYQARAEASPLSSFEGDFFRAWIKAGNAEKVPLFTYIYHEYGPIRMDGWSKLSVEVGDLFYWVASRVTLWGGLFEINCEFSPLEMLNGQNDSSDEHYYQFENRGFGVDPAKASFVGEVAAARAGYAKDYLVYGTMLRPLALDAPTLSLEYFLYNAPKDSKSYNDHGTKAVPQVIHAVWRAPDGKVGLLFVNLHGSESLRLPLSFTAAEYGLAGNLSAEQVTSNSRTSAQIGAQIELPPRRIVLIEITGGV